ncbi:MAG: hypothetical protein IJT00_00940 [Lachnospiraceae bacterium]|nr:hypothetical protein [Lachnospiraceae bacterium]
METGKCPNCTARMEYHKTKGAWICPYCDTRVKEEDTDAEKVLKMTESKGIGLNPDLFYFERDLRESYRKRSTGKCLDSLKYCLDELEFPNETEEYLRRYVSDSDDTSADGINGKLLDNARSVIAQDLEPGERVIVYKDKGLFFKGKEFFVLTDKKMIFVNKKEHLYLYHKDVESSRLDDVLDLPQWELNDNYRMTVYCSEKLLGALLAMITLYAFEEEPDRKKIRIC